MADENGTKRSKKGLLAMLLAAAGAVALLVKKRRKGEGDWEEAKPAA